LAFRSSALRTLSEVHAPRRRALCHLGQAPVKLRRRFGAVPVRYHCAAGGSTPHCTAAAPPPTPAARLRPGRITAAHGSPWVARLRWAASRHPPPFTYGCAGHLRRSSSGPAATRHALLLLLHFLHPWTDSSSSSGRKQRRPASSYGLYRTQLSSAKS
jgi:hypothetical protein